ncbi:MAG TPA: alpha/beta fold hydrolase [Ilumatobacteraceae bacterium]|nr:alpha/beta fold hydrolase [Ilumatobacteraceae bacterium]HRB03435.1 alpha/beta fold hydrolase [Ilumatobacteraceae bacterium]
MTTPVVLVHGWGGSFESTWQRSGFTELLRDVGKPVIGIDLLGHGAAPKPHDPEAYADLTTRVVDAMPDEPVDAVGFSLGAITLLQIACSQPHRFRKLILAGIGGTLFTPDDQSGERIAAAIEGTADSADVGSHVFAQYAHQAGNDPIALAAIMRRPRQRFTKELLAAATCETLVAIGDKDFAGPGEPLAEALPNATLKTLRGVDHFATPEAFAFIDAALEFLDAIPE